MQGCSKVGPRVYAAKQLHRISTSGSATSDKRQGTRIGDMWLGPGGAARRSWMRTDCALIEGWNFEGGKHWSMPAHAPRRDETKRNVLYGEDEPG